jgi:hypothetical protein
MRGAKRGANGVLDLARELPTAARTTRRPLKPQPIAHRSILAGGRFRRFGQDEPKAQNVHLAVTHKMGMSTSGMAMYKYAVNRAGSWGYRAVSSSRRS